MQDNRLKKMDPRTGIIILILANIIVFSQKHIFIELATIVFLLFFMLVYNTRSLVRKWIVGITVLFIAQYYIIPVSPEIIATSFAIFLNYARKMLPCMMVGTLMIKTMSIRELTEGLRAVHVPQSLIVSISITLRYFPAIKEEIGYIRDAISLRNIRGIAKVEAVVVPLMMAATQTAEELSAAAMTRGIDNPIKKTSMIELNMKWMDGMIIFMSLVLTIAAVLG